jgi:hypothetical protein
MAQHCPYDGAGLVVLELCDSASHSHIYNATAFLVDKNNNAAFDYWGYPYMFVQNPQTTTGAEDYPFVKIRYGFAGDNYIMSFPYGENVLKYRIKIKKSGYKEKLVSIDADKVMDMHDYLYRWSGMQPRSAETPSIPGFSQTIVVYLQAIE